MNGVFRRRKSRGRAAFGGSIRASARSERRKGRAGAPSRPNGPASPNSAGRRSRPAKCFAWDALFVLYMETVRGNTVADENSPHGGYCLRLPAAMIFQEYIDA